MAPFSCLQQTWLILWSSLTITRYQQHEDSTRLVIKEEVYQQIYCSLAKAHPWYFIKRNKINHLQLLCHLHIIIRPCMIPNCFSQQLICNCYMNKTAEMTVDFRVSPPTCPSSLAMMRDNMPNSTVSDVETFRFLGPEVGVKHRHTHQKWCTFCVSTGSSTCLRRCWFSLII